MNKLLKYGLLTIVVIFLGYHAVYIQKLSDIKQVNTQFDAATYAQKLWEEQLPQKIDSAVSITTLRAAMAANAETAFSKYAHALAIGNYRYVLAKGTAVVDAVNDDEITITIEDTMPFKASLLTEFIYGNTLRDATGLINLKDFPNTTDLNNISEALNKMIRQKLVPSFKPLLKQGSRIEFTGAAELNKAHVRFDELEIIPVRIKIIS